MQGGRDPFSGFGGPFAGFGDPFAGFGGFGGPRSLMSNFFGGRDPFDDPFFRHPFGGQFESSFFGPFGNPFGDARPSGFLQQQPAEAPRSRRGPIIEELNSDDEKEEKESKSENKDNPRKHGRSNRGAFVEDPDDEAEERSSKLMHFQSDLDRLRETASQPRGHSYTFQSSTVSYGGANGTYYSSSKMRRTGSDGLTFEETKEANSATRQATHAVLRGVHNKGHSVLRKLKSDGRVDTMQTLHNLNEDELAGFEETWNRSARNHLPGLREGHGAPGSGSGAQGAPTRSGGWALPSLERSHYPGTGVLDTREVARPSRPQKSGSLQMRVGDGAGSSQVSSSKAAGKGSAYPPRRH